MSSAFTGGQIHLPLSPSLRTRFLFVQCVVIHYSHYSFGYAKGPSVASWEPLQAGPQYPLTLILALGGSWGRHAMACGSSEAGDRTCTAAGPSHSSDNAGSLTIRLPGNPTSLLSYTRCPGPTLSFPSLTPKISHSSRSSVIAEQHLETRSA